MESYVFSGCTNLQSVSLPNHIKSIPSRSFSCCCHLTNVTIPDGVTAIEGDAFFQCLALRHIVIPKSVTRIDRSAFSESGLRYIEIPESVTSIGEGAFANTKMQYIVLPDAITELDTLKIPEMTIVKHTSDGYDHSRAALHVIEQLPDWNCFPVDIEKWLKVQGKKQDLHLHSDWTKLKAGLAKSYYVEGWCAFRGPTFMIDQLLDELKPWRTRNREDYPSGITQIELDPSVVLEKGERGIDLVGNNLITDEVLEKYAMLQFACFESYRGQVLLYSVSGDRGITRSEYIDCAKNEGDHWVRRHSPLEDDNEMVCYKSVDIAEMSNYSFPYADDWNNDEYIFEKDGRFYRCCPPETAD